MFKKISIFIILMIIFGISGVVNASNMPATINVTNPKSIPYTAGNIKVFCKDYNYSLNTGDTFKFVNAKEVTDVNTAYTYWNYLNSGEYTNLQHYIWEKNYGAKTPNSILPSLYKGKELKDEPFSINLIDKSNAKSVEKTINNEQRIIVGPYKVKVNGTRTINGEYFTKEVGDIELDVKIKGINVGKVVSADGMKNLTINGYTNKTTNEFTFYISLPKNTDLKSKIEVEYNTIKITATEYNYIYQYKAGDTKTYFKGKENPRQELVAIEVKSEIQKLNLDLTGTTEEFKKYELKIIKIDKETKKPLKNAEFSINIYKKYDKVSLYSNKILTDENGIITIQLENNILEHLKTSSVAVLEIKEITAPNGYKLRTETFKYQFYIMNQLYDSITIQKLGDSDSWSDEKSFSSKTPISFTIGNEKDIPQIPQIPLIPNTPETPTTNKHYFSGYVWLDKKNSDKQGEINSILGTEDERYKDMVVKLHRIVNGSDNIVANTKTDTNGYYSFDLENYIIADTENKFYVEFEYNGLKYEIVNNGYNNAINTVNTNKSDEGTGNYQNRTEFNNKFKEITINTNKDENLIKSRTKEISVYKNTNIVVENLNLGIFIRETADISLINDVYEAEVKINGKTKTYYYNRRLLDDEMWEIATRTSSSNYITEYNRPLYMSDINFAKINQPYKATDNEVLQVNVLYRVAIKNQSQILGTSVLELANYFNSNFEIQSAWIGGAKKEDKIADISYTQSAGKATLKFNNNLELENSGQVKYVYINYKVKQNADRTINLGNYGNEIEITKFTSIANAKTPNGSKQYVNKENYGQVDLDSTPGNYDSNTKQKNEDDNDAAPVFKLTENTLPRKLDGTVFEDNLVNEDSSGVLQGDGINNDTNKVGNVAVKLYEIKGNNKYLWYDKLTDINGNYNFEGYVPADYIIEYVYGDIAQLENSAQGQKYNGQDYKSTLYQANNKKDVISVYEIDLFKNQSNAKDSVIRRQEVINYSNGVENTINYKIASILNAPASSSVSTLAEKTKMYAYTPKIIAEVEMKENAETYTDYLINGMDFGISKRPETNIKIEKELVNISIKTQDEVVLVNLEQNIGTEYLRFNGLNEVLVDNDKIQIFLDNEVMQGLNVKYTYKLKVINNSQKDTMENYELSGGTVTTSSLILDYINKNLQYREDEKIDLANISGTNKDNKWVLANSTDLLNKDKNIAVTANQIVKNTLLEEKLKPGETREAYITLTRETSEKDTADLLYFYNEAEIVSITNMAGRKSNYIPGNYSFTTGAIEQDEIKTKMIIILPPAGQERIYYTLGMTIALILIFGIVQIKRKVIDN